MKSLRWHQRLGAMVIIVAFAAAIVHDATLHHIAVTPVKPPIGPPPAGTSAARVDDTLVSRFLTMTSNLYLRWRIYPSVYPQVSLKNQSRMAAVQEAGRRVKLDPEAPGKTALDFFGRVVDEKTIRSAE